MSIGKTVDGLFDKFLSETKIFTNRNVLRHDYVPDNLPHRSEQIEKLASILAPTLKLSKVSNIFLYGKTGTGKTAVARFVLNHLGGKAKKVSARIQTSYINCRLAGTNYRILADLCRTIGVSIPFTGLAVGEVLNRFRNYLNASKTSLIVVLDEIDALIKRQDDDSILYELTRINEGLRENWTSLIGISNDLHFKEFLDPRVLSTLSEEEVVFKPYLADELYDILSDRAKAAFMKDVLVDSALRLCAALAAGEHGDARRALDLLRVAGELAEREGVNNVVEKHVKQAQNKIDRDRVSEVLSSLPLHSKIVLISAYLLGTRSPEGSITGDLFEVYKELSNMVPVEPLTQRRVSGLINELDAMGILNARVVSFGRYGRTKKIRLGVSPTAVNEVLSEDRLVENLFKYTPKYLARKSSR